MPLKGRGGQAEQNRINILRWLSANPQKKMSEVMEGSQIEDDSAARHALNYMEKRGYIKRGKSFGRGSPVRWEATQKGKNEVSKMDELPKEKPVSRPSRALPCLRYYVDPVALENVGAKNVDQLPRQREEVLMIDPFLVPVKSGRFCEPRY